MESTLLPSIQDVQLKKKLQELESIFGVPINSQEYAIRMDEMDPLSQFRTKFTYPKMNDLPCTDPSLVNPDEDCIYLCGNSLGLKPKKADVYMEEVLDCWGKMGVFSHFNGLLPAAYCDVLIKESEANLVGALPEEVVCMNGLTVNLHLLLFSFYQPTADRYKIVIEDNAFPSDRYAVVSQLNLHGYSEEDGLIIIKNRPGEHLLRTEDIVRTIQQNSSSIAVILLCGVHYYSGQKLNMELITRVARDENCLIGWDLAHAVGNVELKLHDWDVDFACWCSYKYLNSGAGGIGGAFVHKRHHEEDRPKLKGWWGNRSETRFEMKHSIDIASGADGYRISNPPPWLVAPHKAGLEIYEEASMKELLDKQYLITGYLEYLIDDLNDNLGHGKLIQLITPRNPRQRGTQLSLMFSVSLKKIHQELEKRGVVCDIRLPSVMRLAPVALYVSYQDVYRFICVLKEVLEIPDL